MQSILHLNQPGFSRFVSVSVVLHFIIMGFALYMARGEHKKIFFTPTYTEIEIVKPRTAKVVKKKPRPAEIKKKKAAPKPPVKPNAKPVQKAAPAKKAAPVKISKPVKAPAPAIADAIVLKKVPAPRPAPALIEPALSPDEPAEPKVVEEPINIDDTLSRLEEIVKEKSEESLIASRLEALSKKTAAEDEATVQRLSELKDMIAVDSIAMEATDESAAAAYARVSDGISKELFDIEFKAYYNKVSEKTQALWVYSGSINKNASTIIGIKVGRDGALIDYWIEKRSGNDRLDDSVIKAVMKAAPYPPLPERLDEDYLEIGIRFCPGGCAS